MVSKVISKDSTCDRDRWEGGDTLNRDLHIETSRMEGGGAHGVMVYNVHFYIFP